VTGVDPGSHFDLLLGQNHGACQNKKPSSITCSATVTLIKGEKRHIIRLDSALAKKRASRHDVRCPAKKFVNALKQTRHMIVCHVKEVSEVTAQLEVFVTGTSRATADRAPVT
jgi:hypothetical protein